MSRGHRRTTPRPGSTGRVDAWPDSYLALAGRARAAAALGDTDAAIAGYQAAIAVAPQPDALTALGDLLALRGDTAAADEQYATVQAIARLQGDGGLVYNRQLVLFDVNHDRDVADALDLAERRARGAQGRLRLRRLRLGAARQRPRGRGRRGDDARPSPSGRATRCSCTTPARSPLALGDRSRARGPARAGAGHPRRARPAVRRAREPTPWSRFDEPAVPTGRGVRPACAPRRSRGGARRLAGSLAAAALVPSRSRPAPTRSATSRSTTSPRIRVAPDAHRARRRHRPRRDPGVPGAAAPRPRWRRRARRGGARAGARARVPRPRARPACSPSTVAALTPRSTAAGLSLPPGAGGLLDDAPRLRVRGSARRRRSPRSSTDRVRGSLVRRADRLARDRRPRRRRRRSPAAIGPPVERRRRLGRLTAYPTDLLAQPLDMRSVALRRRAGRRGPRAVDRARRPALDGGSPARRRWRAPRAPSGGACPAAIAEDLAGAHRRHRPDPARDPRRRWPSPSALGVVHALSPGHGKTIMAAYLVGGARLEPPGDRARAGRRGLAHARRAGARGDHARGLERPAAGAPVPDPRASSRAALVIVIGASLLWSRLRAVRASAGSRTRTGTSTGTTTRTSTATTHGHEHDHGHPHPHPHDHAPADDHDLVARPDRARAVRRPRPVGVGADPAARLDRGRRVGLRPRARLGFGLGMAVVLAGIGLALVHARRLVERRPVGRAARASGRPAPARDRLARRRARRRADRPGPDPGPLGRTASEDDAERASSKTAVDMPGRVDHAPARRLLPARAPGSRPGPGGGSRGRTTPRTGCARRRVLRREPDLRVDVEQDRQVRARGRRSRRRRWRAARRSAGPRRSPGRRASSRRTGRRGRPRRPRAPAG